MRLRIRIATGTPVWRGASWPRIHAPGLAVVACIVALTGVVSWGRVCWYRPWQAPPNATALRSPGESDLAALRRLDAETRGWKRRLETLKPRGIHLVIDASHNRLYLKRGDAILHEAVCSTGSGLLLRDPAGGRQWVFDTPRGLFRVREKTRDPVWKKPDWAFLEEGKPIPQRFSERLDPDSLGDYALYFGDGYMIHGTLYQRYLGRNVTHGCVRLGDSDLEKVFRMTPQGAPIYIF
jgi:L,D-transpeptidase YbiS